MVHPPASPLSDSPPVPVLRLAATHWRKMGAPAGSGDNRPTRTGLRGVGPMLARLPGIVERIC